MGCAKGYIPGYGVKRIRAYPPRVRLRLFVRGNGHVLASTKAHGWTCMPDERGRVSATYDLRPPEVANASVNAGVDRVCVRHLVGGCRGLPRLGEGRG